MTILATRLFNSTFQVSNNNTVNSTSLFGTKSDLPEELQIFSRLDGEPPAPLDINKAVESVADRFEGVLNLHNLEGRSIDRNNL